MIEILLQGEGIREVQVVTLPADAGLVLLIEEARRLGSPHGDGEEVHVFHQDEDEPLRAGRLPSPKHGKPLCLHVHRNRQIEVEARYNGHAKSISVAPSRTVGWLRDRIARKLFGMEPRDAAEHVLQLSGTTERPEPDTHVGSLARHGRVCFDLVPLVRVEGRP